MNSKKKPVLDTLNARGKKRLSSSGEMTNGFMGKAALEPS